MNELMKNILFAATIYTSGFIGSLIYAYRHRHYKTGYNLKDAVVLGVVWPLIYPLALLVVVDESVNVLGSELDALGSKSMKPLNRAYMKLERRWKQ